MAGSEDEKKYRKKKAGSRERRSEDEESGEERKSKDKKSKEKKGGKYSEGESGGEEKKSKKDKKSKSKSKEEESEEDKDEGHSGKKEKEKKKDKGGSEEEGEKSEKKKDKKEKSKDEKSKDEGDSKKKDKDKSKDKDKEDKDKMDKDKDKKSKYHDAEDGHGEHKSIAGSSSHVDVGKVPVVGQAAVKVVGAFASSQAWLDAAKKTTTEFKASGPKSPTTWVLVENNQISPDAIRAGEDKTGIPFYVARAFHEGGLHIGRASKNGALIGYGGREISVPQYEVLLGDPKAIKWVSCANGSAGVRAVEGGIDSAGKSLMIAQTLFNGEIIPGKATDWISGALIALGGKEVNVKEFNILAYA